MLKDPVTSKPMEIIIDGNAGQLIDLGASTLVTGNGQVIETTVNTLNSAEDMVHELEMDAGEAADTEAVEGEVELTEEEMGKLLVEF